MENKKIAEEREDETSILHHTTHQLLIDNGRRTVTSFCRTATPPTEIARPTTTLTGRGWWWYSRASLGPPSGTRFGKNEEGRAKPLSPDGKIEGRKGGSWQRCRRGHKHYRRQRRGFELARFERRRWTTEWPKMVYVRRRMKGERHWWRRRRRQKRNPARTEAAPLH